MSAHDVVLIPGDGIGPEVTSAALRILEAAEAPLAFDVHQAGLAALEAGQDVLPASTGLAASSRASCSTRFSAS